jgi:hypothetical protein
MTDVAEVIPLGFLNAQLFQRFIDEDFLNAVSRCGTEPKCW